MKTEISNDGKGLNELLNHHKEAISFLQNEISELTTQLTPLRSSVTSEPHSTEDVDVGYDIGNEVSKQTASIKTISDQIRILRQEIYL